MRLVSFLGVIALMAPAALAQTAPALGSAASFALHASSNVSSAGTSHVTGNVGVSPGRRVSGLAVSLGDIHRDDALARQAQRDGAAAFAALERLSCTAIVFDATPVAPGVYCVSTPLAGTVVLDAKGDRNAVWIFRMAGALVTADGSSVLLSNGAADGNVFWAIGGAATLGAASSFAGSLFATTITLGEGARLSGRALARDGPISLRANEVSVCCRPIVLTAPALPRATASVPYPPQTFVATGGFGAYTFTQSGLPEGMSVSGGVLQGTSLRTGRFPFRVTAIDELGCSGSADFVLDIDTCLLIEPAELPPSSCPYEAKITARGCTPPYRFEVTGGALPSGLELFDDGTIGGRPKAATTSSFTITVTDARGISASRTYTLATVACPCPIPLDPPALPDGKECVPYVKSFAGPYTFSAPQDRLPPGLVFTSPMLGGTPTKAGRYSFPVTATDGASTCTREYTVDIACPEIVVSPAALPEGVAGDEYKQQFSSTPCDGTFSASGGPPGLQPLTSTGLLTGVPTKTGPFELTVTARSPSGECVGTRTYTIEIVCDAITVAPPFFANGTVGVHYAAPLAISGGVAPYHVAVVSGALPPGLEFEGPTLIGTPAAAGTFTFTLRITDDAGCPGGDVAGAIDIDPAPPVATSVIPTISPWTLFALAMLLASLGLWRVHVE